MLTVSWKILPFCDSFHSIVSFSESASPFVFYISATFSTFPRFSIYLFYGCFLLVRFNIKKQDTIFVVLSQYTDQQRTYLPTTISILFRHKSLTVCKLYFGSALFDAWIYEHLWSCTCRWFLGLLTMPVNVVRPCFSHQRLWKHS